MPFSFFGGSSSSQNPVVLTWPAVPPVQSPGNPPRRRPRLVRLSDEEIQRAIRENKFGAKVAKNVAQPVPATEDEDDFGDE